jgi:FtsP/CotA-like multicopper oxidase with cupredoxin domain
MISRLGLAALLVPLALWSTASVPSPRALDPVVENDNRTPAGRIRGDTLEIHLRVGMATWRPEADSGPAIDVAAIAEEGHAPTVPGPFIRVTDGTVIHVTITNTLTDSSITVHGLYTRPASERDSLVLEPGATGALRFPAGAPGTYFYMATLGHHVFGKDDEREQLSGAFIIDPAAGSPPDRVLMLNIWGRTIDPKTYSNALTINGRSWPYTERITATVGDTLRWRVINATARNHPMHLHGFYYRVDSRGDIAADTTYSPANRRLVVTEGLQPLTTLTMDWSPDRPGNWLYHCHIGFHVLPDARVNPVAASSHDRMAHDPRVHMAGLVLGISVAPKPGAATPVDVPARRLRLFIQEGRRRGRAPRAMGVVLQRGGALPAPDSVEIPGSPLILTRGEPVDVVVINHLAEPTAVHWHGIELGSYSDGVPGWSGGGEQLAPSIEPGDSFVARLTLPRAGTFMYHTHMNDLEQITSGVYGPIVVLERGQRFDAATDHVFIAGWDGQDDPPHTIINGDSLPAPLTLKAGLPHRLRFINIGPANRFRFFLMRDSSIVSWRQIAKDGADLPASQRKLVPAVRALDVGETADVVVRPSRGEYHLVAAKDLKEPYYVQRVIVK